MTGATLRHLAIVRDPAGGPQAWRFVRTQGPDPARALEGRPAEEAARLAPRIFNLCGAAHGFAAARALGLDADADAGAMARESVRDHALAILHGWPGLFGDLPDRAALRALAQPGPEADLALAVALVGGRLAGRDFGALTRAELSGWLCAGETATARILSRLRREADPAQGRAGLPELTAIDLARALRDEGDGTLPPARAIPPEESEPGAGAPAARTPPTGPDALAPAALPPMAQPRVRPHGAVGSPPAGAEDGAAIPPRARPPRETGALGRVAGTPLFTTLLADEGPSLFVRLLARLADLVALLAEPAPARPDAPAGMGLADAARGLLGHGARMEEGRVARYRILSPSAWNLAPGGLLERVFAALDPASPQAPLLAGLALSAVNPCVPVTLDLQGARHDA